MTDNAEATLEWLATELADLQRQADALDERMDVLQEVKARLTGTAFNNPMGRKPRKRRGAQQEQQAPSVPAEPEMAL